MSGEKPSKSGYKEVFICAPLAALAAQHNAACDEQQREQQRDYIAGPGEGWRRVRVWRKDRVNYSGGPPGKLLHDIAAAVDHRADSCRRRAKHGDSFLGRP